MIEKGLAAASSAETTTAPKTMYEEMEQDENVARGNVKVTEIIAYDFVKKEKVIDEFTGDETGEMRTVEKGRSPYFCQNKEDVRIFMINNPDARTETFEVQLLKSTAIKYLNAPRNMKQFTNPEPVEAVSMASPTQTLEEPESNWRKLAKKLGIPLNKETGGSRKKEDVLMDIVFQTTTSTS